MLLSPFQHQSHCAAGQAAAEDLKRLNIDQCFKFSIKRMEMRRNMVPEIHLNQDSVEPADRRHQFPRVLVAQRIGYFRFANLVQRIDGQAAEQFGEEVGGLLGHDVAGESDFAELLHGDGVGEEGDVGFAAAGLVYGFGGVAQVADVGLLADLFRVEAEQAVEDDGVQMAEVELALAIGQIGERGVDGIGLRAQQEGAGFGDGDEGRAVLRRRGFACSLWRRRRAAARR